MIGATGKSPLLWLLGIALCCAVFFASQQLTQRDLALRSEEIDTQNLNLVRSLGQSINFSVSTADTILLFMKTEIESEGRLLDRHRDLLRTLLARGSISQIAVSDARGNLIFSAVPLSAPLNIADREHFQVHVREDTGRIFIAPTRVAQVTGKTAIFMSRRLNDAAGRFAGIVSVGLSQDYFSEEFQRLNMGPDNSIILLGTDGRFIARVPAFNSGGHKTFTNHPAIAMINQGLLSGVYASTGGDGAARLGAFRVLPDYPVVVMVGIRREPALAAVVSRTSVYRIGALAFSMLTISALIIMSAIRKKHYLTEQALSEEKERATEFLSQIERHRIEADMARMGLIGEMAASLGHEIRNPLTTVRGYLQLFTRKAVFGEYQPQLKTMIDELDRANQIITEFLSLSKDKRTEFVPTAVNDIILSLFPLIAADANRDGLEVVLDLDDSPPLMLDANEIRQLVLNLTRNGIDAMKPGGKLTLSVKRRDHEVLLSIRDEGAGIPPDVLGKLGTPFLTTKTSGTGLGLAVCKKIVERHNAQMNISTGPGGTTVTVRFPSFAQAAGP